MIGIEKSKMLKKAVSIVNEIKMKFYAKLQMQKLNSGSEVGGYICFLAQVAGMLHCK